jgi:hypothetical protein
VCGVPKRDLNQLEPIRNRDFMLRCVDFIDNSQSENERDHPKCIWSGEVLLVLTLFGGIPGVTDRRNDAGDDRRNGASLKRSKTRIRTDSRMRFLGRFRKPRLVGFWHGSGRAETVTIEHDAISAMS